VGEEGKGTGNRKKGDDGCNNVRGRGREGGGKGDGDWEEREERKARGESEDGGKGESWGERMGKEGEQRLGG